MTEPEHLENAPIAEALLDIRVVLPQKVSADELAGVQARFKAKYPTRQVRKLWTGAVEFRPGEDPVAKAAEGPKGFLFSSADGKEVVQAREDGFSFSRLHPYTNWEQFSESARSAWEAYTTVLKPRSVIRIALRYINRIPLPLPFSDIRDYVATGPMIAPELPQLMKAFFLRVVVQDEQTKATVVITETMEEPKDESTMPLILDIDAYRTGAFPTEGDKLWTQLGHLHELKNRVFFSSITDATKDLLR